MKGGRKVGRKEGRYRRREGGRDEEGKEGAYGRSKRGRERGRERGKEGQGRGKGGEAKKAGGKQKEVEDRWTNERRRRGNGRRLGVRNGGVGRWTDEAMKRKGKKMESFGVERDIENSDKVMFREMGQSKGKKKTE